MITEDMISGVFHTASVELVEEFVYVFNKFSSKFLIETEFQTNAFLAQLREEVGPSLVPKREGLNYSCVALRKTFKYYRNNPKESERDGRCNQHKANQRKIANKAYANRIGNENYNSGDGYRFRGGGFIQLTGRDNYTRMAQILSLVLQKKITPLDVESEISEVGMGLLVSMAFYLDKKLYTCKHIDCFTKKINRYTDSYQKRKEHYLHIASL